MGLVALSSLPREEEPQISVPLVDIHIQAPGLRAEDAIKLVTEPLETIVKSIDGVDHVYSQTGDDSAMVTARFLVGTSSDAAILRVHDKVRANLDRIPVGIPEPLIVGRGIDDVAIVSLTLSPRPGAEGVTANDLTRIARELRSEVAKTADVGLTYSLARRPRRSASFPTRNAWRFTASPCSSLPARCNRPTGPSTPASCATRAVRSTWWQAKRWSLPRRWRTCC